MKQKGSRTEKLTKGTGGGGHQQAGTSEHSPGGALSAELWEAGTAWGAGQHTGLGILKVVGFAAGRWHVGKWGG